jgi:uncharacterized BrkB/YihY/UPF0761 family membrane protein
MYRLISQTEGYKQPPLISFFTLLSTFSLLITACGFIPALLFDTSTDNIALHIKNICSEGELSES